MKKSRFIYVLWKEGKYHVSQCLNVDISSFGKTKKEAVQNLEEALGLFLEDAPGQISRIQYPVIIERELQYA